MFQVTIYTRVCRFDDCDFASRFLQLSAPFDIKSVIKLRLMGLSLHLRSYFGYRWMVLKFHISCWKIFLRADNILQIRHHFIATCLMAPFSVNLPELGPPTQSSWLLSHRFLFLQMELIGYYSFTVIIRIHRAIQILILEENRRAHFLIVNPRGDELFFPSYFSVRNRFKECFHFKIIILNYLN